MTRFLRSGSGLWSGSVRSGIDSSAVTKLVDLYRDKPSFDVEGVERLLTLVSVLMGDVDRPRTSPGAELTTFDGNGVVVASLLFLAEIVCMFGRDGSELSSASTEERIDKRWSSSSGFVIICPCSMLERV